MSWRLRVARTLVRAAQAVHFFAVALLREDDLLASVRQKFSQPEEVERWTRAALDGLWPEEEALIPALPRSGARALILGCGAGREAIALAKRGWQVTAFDHVAVLLAAGEKAARRASVSIDWQWIDYAQGIPLTGPFDLIGLFNMAYAYLPTRQRRTRLLAECRKLIAPDGRCVLVFPAGDAPSAIRLQAHHLRVFLARLVGGNHRLEANDHWEEGHSFYHHFSSLTELEIEARPAGWVLDRSAAFTSGTASLVPALGSAVPALS